MELLGEIFYPRFFSGPWPHPLRVHGVVLLARSPVLEKLPQILKPGLNFSVFQREIRVVTVRVGDSPR